MDVFGLTDAIKKRRKLLDSIDQSETPVPQASIVPATPEPAGGAYSGMDQKSIDEIRARRKKLMDDWEKANLK
jgi:hypothetical protein